LECLESIFSDPYPNKELVIIDDASSDNSVSIVRAWVEKHADDMNIIFHAREKNKGFCSALNEMLEMCSGEYVTIIASDDYLLPGGVEARIKYLEENPKKLSVIGDCIVIDDDGNVLHKSGLSGLHNANLNSYISDKGMKHEIIRNWSIPGPVLLLKKRVYDEVGFYNENLIVEDRDFYLRLVAKNYLGFIRENVAAYRLHGSNTGANKLFKLRMEIDHFYSLYSNAHKFTWLDRFYIYYKAFHAFKKVLKTMAQ